MGLDMYAFRVAGLVDAPAVDAQLPEGASQQIAYWRKHPNLHGWMEKLYRAKGGADPSFNTNTVELTAADIDKLESDIRGGRLPSTSGFFFGATDGSEFEDDLSFVVTARAAIDAGERVFYDSWW